ncbi:cytochrome b561 and DOMON domain-containing protein [Cinnamomum micranthum f. kanehirae]|uniref:Cytochrome b561 and DOMON domain-containing protein n=1 Tax=Cinnamomum micranthum f. kanehirae TaxID=337451 RepID=A0A3S3NW40_9MAGN|nr:cytochrome b561 and DOMON domain-containing protein [Cinnamomum micranthum f. kanehirae]
MSGVGLCHKGVSIPFGVRTDIWRGPAYLLELFKEFKPYAWAPTCVGNLYRMLTKGVKWSGIKNIEGAEAAIPAGLDPTDESDAFEHMFKSMSGPLQLLQALYYRFLSTFELDKEILEGFHRYYTTRKDELDVICSLVDHDTLNDLLEPDTLLDTNVIYYYFEYLRNAYGEAYLEDLSLCDWELVSFQVSEEIWLLCSTIIVATSFRPIFLLCFLLSLFLSSSAQSCSNYTFSSNRAFTSCNSLPQLNAHLHWNYNPSRGTIDVAYRAIQSSAGWVAWAINPIGLQMAGSEALVAYQSSSNGIRAYTTSVSSYDAAWQSEL